MKKLEVGDFVYSKKYGRGIISKVGVGYMIFFERIGETDIGHRNQLFTRGDYVTFDHFINYPYPHYDRSIGEFYEHIEHNPKVKSHFTVMYHGKIKYVKHIEHRDNGVYLHEMNRPICKHHDYNKPTMTSYKQFKENCNALESEYSRLFGPSAEEAVTLLFKSIKNGSITKPLLFESIKNGSITNDPYQGELDFEPPDKTKMMYSLERMKRISELRKVGLSSIMIDNVLSNEGYVMYEK